MSTSTSKTTRSGPTIQQRIKAEDLTVTLDKIRLFLQDKPTNICDRDIRNKIIKNYFSSETFVQHNYEQLADFFNDGKIEDEWKKLLLTWVLLFITIPKLQELAENLNNSTFKNKIYTDVINVYINHNKFEDARMIVEKIIEHSKKQSLQAQILKKQNASKRITQKQKGGGGKRKQQPIHQLIQQSDTSVTFDALCDFFRGDDVDYGVYNRYITYYFSSTKMLQDNYDKLANFFNDNTIPEFWRRLALIYVPQKIRDSLLLRDLATNLTNQGFKNYIMRPLGPTDNTSLRTKSGNKLKRNTKSQGGVTVKNVQRQTKQNSDSSTGLLGLGAVAVGVFMVVLLGVRYRK